MRFYLTDNWFSKIKRIKNSLNIMNSYAIMVLFYPGICQVALYTTMCFVLSRLNYEHINCFSHPFRHLIDLQLMPFSLLILTENRILKSLLFFFYLFIFPPWMCSKHASNKWGDWQQESGSLLWNHRSVARSHSMTIKQKQDCNLFLDTPSIGRCWISICWSHTTRLFAKVCFGQQII